MQDSQPTIKSNFIDHGLRELKDIPDLSRSLFQVLSSLEKYQKELQDCKKRSEALSKMQQYISAWDLFHGTAYYLVNKDFEFELKMPTHELHNEALNQFITKQIREGKFAWALQQNREIIIDSPEDLPGEQILLHGMSTSQTTLGVFVGFLKDDSSTLRSSFFRILSIMIDAVAYVIENRNLQQELTQYNQHLETIVSARTQELQHANQHLYQSNSELKKLSQKKSEFLGIVAHDLKNPLSGIIGFSDLIDDNLAELERKGNEGLSTTREMMKYIGSSAHDMVNALNELMDSEIIESGKLKLNPVEFCFNELASEVVKINQPQAASKGIVLNFKEAVELMIEADPLRIREAMDNLVSNAIKYSPPDEEVWIKVFPLNSGIESGKLVFSVTDNGPGLSDDDKSKLFGRFQKLSAQPTAGESSTGLGLSIVKNLIELHHGHVNVVSAIGQGSTFSFELPTTFIANES